MLEKNLVLNETGLECTSIITVAKMARFHEKSRFQGYINISSKWNIRYDAFAWHSLAIDTSIRFSE